MTDSARIGVVAIAKSTIWAGLDLYGRASVTATFETKTVRAICTGVAYEGFNAAVGTRVASPSDIARALDMFRRAGAPMLWHVWQDEVDIEPLLVDDHGLTLYEEEPAMILDLDAARVSPPPPPNFEPGLATDAQLATWAGILTGNSHRPFLRRVAELRRASGTGGPRFEHLLGFVGGIPVATAAVFHGTGSAEIQHVATVRTHRHRGIGTAMTVAAIDVARAAGHRYAVLTASPEGAGIYRRLGFETIDSVRRFCMLPVDTIISPTA